MFSRYRAHVASTDHPVMVVAVDALLLLINVLTLILLIQGKTEHALTVLLPVLLLLGFRIGRADSEARRTLPLSTRRFLNGDR